MSDCVVINDDRSVLVTDFAAVPEGKGQSRKDFFNGRAALRIGEQKRTYNALLRKYYRYYIPRCTKVLEVGCGVGDLIESVEPSFGVGIDFSENAIAIAKERHPHISFVVANAEDFSIDGVFDYIIVSDLVNDLFDVQLVLNHLKQYVHPRTRLVLNFFNNLWRPTLYALETFNFKAPTMSQNWLSSSDMRNLLHLSGWDLVKEDRRILAPAAVAGFERIVNRLGPLFSHFCLSVFQVARIQPLMNVSAARLVASGQLRNNGHSRSCSVIIHARNEEGNIESAVQRVPPIGETTELIFVEGHSKDGTWNELHRVARKYPNRDIKILKQQSEGKGGAVREGFAAAHGDIVMILDADLTTPPEQLPRFYEILCSGKAEFVNGVRLVYPMEDESMQFLNMVANKLFGLTFSWLLGQHVKDTLCGTKALFRRDYEEISRNRSFFGDFDPFGDFDLLFGAAKLNLKIVDLPIRYGARSYGETNIRRWQHGVLLLRMASLAALRLKFT
jgi:ubiquinone/menaquinone biosynthesis C-methylase UbiE